MSTKIEKTYDDFLFLSTRRCSNCPLAETCEYFISDTSKDSCVIDKAGNKQLDKPIELTQDLNRIYNMGMQNLIKLDNELKQSGIGYNPELTKEMKSQIELIQKIKDLMGNKQKINIQVEGDKSIGAFSQIFASKGATE
jgi:hypothetical protein